MTKNLKRAHRIAEGPGDFSGGATVDEESSEGFVDAVFRDAGSEEIAAALT
jgi:hypothetical protein